jgi:sugar lactone lactonase YvrE
VTGPNGFDTTLTASSTLTDLEPGSYTVTADTLVVDDPVVVSRYLAVVEQSPDTVTAGDTVTANVTYAIRTGSGGLWFTNTGSSTISRFAAAQLHASGTPTDTTGITTADGALFAAFDSSGNLWASSATSADLVAFTRDQLVAGGTPTPTRTLSSTALQDPRGIAFDAHRNLWVANAGNGTLLEFSASQVEDGGPQTPYLTITNTGLSQPTAIAFDAAGNLWVTDREGGRVAKFTPAQLAVDGDHAPAVVLSASSGSLDHPSALAFDVSDNLWVANDPAAGTAASVVSFAPTDRAVTGTPEPSTTITLDDDSSPYGLAFDESGSLWIALNSANALVKFTTDQLSTGGALTPDVTITQAAGGSMSGPSALIFDPHAAGLPINW